MKFSEPFTGGLALAAAEVLDQSAVAVTGRQCGDANWDDDHALKDIVGLLNPAAVVDLHMMRDSHGPQVCLGRGSVPDLADPLACALQGELTRAGLECSVDVPFDASRHTTVTTHSQRQGRHAVQVEVAASVLTSVSGRDQFARGFLSGLRCYLTSLTV